MTAIKFLEDVNKTVARFFSEIKLMSTLRSVLRILKLKHNFSLNNKKQLKM